MALGAGALTRIFVVLWTPFLLLFLLIADIASRRYQRRHLVHLAMVAAVVTLSIAPVVARNVSQYGSWTLTPQGGAHLMHWVLPLIKESQDGTPWATGTAQIEAQFRERFPDPSRNVFIESPRTSEFGKEMRFAVGVLASSKPGWSAPQSISALLVVIAPPVAQLPRTGFYDTKAA